MSKHKINSENKSILCIGSGKSEMKSVINMDIVPAEGVNFVHDFNDIPWPGLADSQFDEVYIPHSIHCVDNLLRFMEEVHRVCKPNAKIIINSVNFLSPIACQDAFFKTRIGWNTFDVFQEIHHLQGVSYDTTAKFEIVKRKWIFSENKYLKWLSPLFNIFPKFYARFTYFWMPCNELEFKLRCLK